MNFDSPELEEGKILRVKNIRVRLQGMEKDILAQVNQGYQDILKNSTWCINEGRYAKYHSKLNHRIRLS